MTAKEHNRTLGILFLVYLGLQIFGVMVGLIFLVAFSGYALNEMGGNDAIPVGIMVAAFGVGMFISILLLIPIAMAGWKLFKEKPNARIWGIIASVVALLSIPLGTILGIYGLWFLCGEQGKQYYEGGQIASHNPPPPNNWQ